MTSKSFDLVEDEDEPNLRARPFWVAPNEDPDKIQQEINVTVDAKNPNKEFQVGKNRNNDILIKLQAVSGSHSCIGYTESKGWTVKDNHSTNGTYVFMKTMQHTNDHSPSDLIPLYHDMTIGFCNYEIEVKIN